MTAPDYGRIVLDLDVEDDRLERAIDRAARRASRSAGRTLDRELGRSSGRAGLRSGTRFARNFTRGVGTIVTGLGISLFAPLVVGAGAAGVLAATQFAAALVPLAGSLAFLPALLAGVSAGVATLVVGFQGMGDALGAAFSDAEEFNEAIEDLAPSAQNAARAFRGITDELSAIRRVVQQRLFEGIGDEISELADVLLPRLNAGMRNIASAINTQFREVFAGFSDAANLEDLSQVLDNFAAGARASAPGLRSLIDAFSDLAAVGSDFLVPLGEGFSEMAQQFEDFIAQARTSGALREFFEGVVEGLGQIIRIGGNVFGVLRDIFSAAGVATGGLLASLERVTGAIRDFTSSAEGAQTLETLFISLNRIAMAFAPVFRQLFDTLANQIVPAFADIAERLGPSLSRIIENVGEAFADIGPELGENLADIADSFAEILPVVIRLLGPLTNLLAAVLRPLVPVVQALGPVLGALANAAAALAGPLATMAAGFLALRGVGRILRGFRVAVAATTRTLAVSGGGFTAFGRRLRGLRGFAGLAGLTLAFEALNIDLVDGKDALDLAGAGFSALAATITGNKEALNNLRREFGPAARELRDFFTGGFLGTFDSPQQAADMIGRAFGTEEDMQRLLDRRTEQARIWLTDFQLTVEEGFSGVQETVTRDWTNQLAETLDAGFMDANETVFAGMSSLGTSIAVGAAAAGARAEALQTAVQTAVVNTMRVANQTIATGMVELAREVRDGSRVAGAQASALSGPLTANIASAASGAVDAMVDGMSSLANAVDVGVRDAANSAADLGDQVIGAIGNIDLFNAGFTMMNSLRQGIAAAGEAVLAAASSIAAGVRGLFPSSPAKWGPFAGQGHPEILGKNLMRYLASGMTAGQRDVARAARGGALAASGIGGGGFAQFGPAFGGGRQSLIQNNLSVTTAAQDPRSVASIVGLRLDSMVAGLSA